MKTLILQLARLGDIYQTWPIVRGLKRVEGADTQIHLLTREAFKSAAEGLAEVDRNWTIDTKDILGPIVNAEASVEQSLDRLNSFIETLRAENFERIINLSFSPFSSRLVSAIAKAETKIFGYTRHTDGFLSIPDDASAYFYAQVGSDRFNRMHVTDLFAQVAGIDLVANDWKSEAQFIIAPSAEAQDVLNGPSPIVVHLGASQVAKTYGTHKWMQVIRKLVDDGRAPVILVGSKAEQSLASAVKESSSGKSAIDLVGKTEIRDLFRIIKHAKLVIGGDSAPVHIAALTNTPVLNLSFSTVNFWETGPKSSGSRILAFDSANDLASDTVVSEAFAMLDEKKGDARAICVTSSTAPYQTPSHYSKNQVHWDWCQAMYMGQPFPIPESDIAYQGLMRLFEANELAIEQLATLDRKQNDETALLILDRFDQIIQTISGMVPSLGILIRWFQTERIRLGPMEAGALLSRTRALHYRLHDILSLYHRTQEQNDNLKLE